MATAGKIGLPEMKRILDDNGIKYVEMEFLLDWFADGERRRESDKIRAEMLEAAAALGMRDIKVRSWLPRTCRRHSPDEG